MVTHLTNLLQEAVEGETWVEIIEVVDGRDGDREEEEFQAFDDFKLASYEHFRFGNRSVSRDQMDDALDFYRQPEKGSRTLSAMMSRYRWIKIRSDMIKLWNYEADRDNFKESRTNLLKLLSFRMYEIVKEKFENGYILHDDGLMIITKDINQRETKIDGFVASQSWITRWKRSHRIVSRRITKFVTKKCLLDRAVIEKTAEEFVKTTRREMSLFSPSMVFNADQTGIQKEIYGARAFWAIRTSIV